MTDLFPAAVNTLLGPAVEGAHSNDPNDPGGDTKWAVARNRHPEVTDAQWAAWTRDDSTALLRSGYWDKNRCGEMPWAWAYAVFDGAVNQGTMAPLVQRVLGVQRDGVIGPSTLAAIRAATTEHLALFIALRLKAYIPLPRFPDDGTGWFKRTVIAAITGATAPQSSENIGGSP